MESATKTAKTTKTTSTSGDRIRRRHAALTAIRAFFVERGFLEVDTPLLSPGPGLEPHIDALAVDVRITMDPRAQPERRWLITSPELNIKRLLATTPDVTKVFQLTHVFRDGERTQRHLPEFTMLEWYRVGGSLDDLVADHEGLFASVARALDVAAPQVPFHRETIAALFQRHAQLDVTSPSLVDDVRARGDMLRPGADADADFEDAFFHVMGVHVEPNLARERPVVVERWPASMAVLARRCADDARFAERFEVYGRCGQATLEISNAFAELTDPVEQRARFLDDNTKRRSLGKPELPLDEDFLAALGQLPPTSGCALGVERLLMLLLQATDIDEVTAQRWR